MRSEEEPNDETTASDFHHCSRRHLCAEDERDTAKGDVMRDSKERPDPNAVSLKDKLIGLTEVNAPAPLSNAVRDQELAPKTGTRHFIPRDERIEEKLIEVEKLIRRRSYNAAIGEANRTDLGDSHLASTYALMLREKTTRAQVALGDRYLADGDAARAKDSYQAAVEPRASDAMTRAVADLTRTAVREVVSTRTELIGKIKTMMGEARYEDWCDTRRRLQDSSILDHVRAILPDVRLADALGPRVPSNWPPKGNPKDGWVDPVLIDDLAGTQGLAGLLLDRPAVLPGAGFSSLSAKSVGLDAIRAFSLTEGRRVAPAVFEGGQLPELRASSAFPLMSSMLTAHTRLYASEFALNAVGLSPGSMPIYRYSYLIEQARRILTFIAGTDARMTTMQFKLDDFAELIGTIKSHIDENSAEYQALNARIGELSSTLTTLTKAEHEMGGIVTQLAKAEDDCDPEWWEVLLSVVVVIVATAVGAAIGFLIGGIPGAIAGGAVALGTSIALTIQVWSDREINCSNVSQALGDFRTSQSALQAALSDNTAELNHALLQRDATIAQLASLQDTYDAAVTSNRARALNAETLSHILGVLDSVRSTAVLRAHSLARMAQDAYNAETDTSLNVIAASHSDYLDKDARGYTAATVLQRDLDGLEHIRLTSRTRKQMQLSQIVSLRKHYPAVFASILTSGQGRFATRLSDFDRWFPGAYMQRIKEVRVEVLVDDKPQPIRGYLTNDGVSFVRFADHGNKIKVDGRDVLGEPDDDLRKLCYKRRRRHHAVETMAFPSHDSFLFEARATEQQQQERNFFEGCGLESTWHLELTPDQVVEYSRITDVRIHMQCEALFDPALQSVVESKRYTDRKETAIISVRQLLSGQGAPVNFSETLGVEVTSFLFEAPHIPKTIRDVGVMLRSKQLPLLAGKAKLRINYQGQTAIEVETNEQGIVATAPDKPAGTNTDALRGLVEDKSVAGRWSIKILDLPTGLTTDDLDDVLLMIRYTFKPS
jgi:hypothetical protein